MHLIFDSQTRRCTGSIEGSAEGFSGGILVAVDAIPENLSTLVLNAQGKPVQDAALALQLARAARLAAIKQEAATLLAATDWKLQRAKEREQAGWLQVADVAAVLAEREAIRRSSNAAEEAVAALTDVAAVNALTWAPDAVAVPAPRLLTHEQLIGRFTAQEWQAMTEAARANTAMDAWMRRFALANIISLDDPATAAAIHALELAGILAQGRADDILGAAHE